jgi:hypothetical protein
MVASGVIPQCDYSAQLLLTSLDKYLLIFHVRAERAELLLCGWLRSFACYCDLT